MKERLTFLFFPLVKSKEWQMNCLPVMVSHAWNHAELYGLCFMGATSWGHKRFEKIKKFATWKFTWCLYNIDAYACLQFVNKVKMERITVFMRNGESAFWKKGMFFDCDLQSSVRILHGCENLGFRCCAMPIIMTSMPKFATYRVKVEQIILCMKIANRYFERK